MADLVVIVTGREMEQAAGWQFQTIPGNAPNEGHGRYFVLCQRPPAFQVLFSMMSSDLAGYSFGSIMPTI